MATLRKSLVGVTCVALLLLAASAQAAVPQAGTYLEIETQNEGMTQTIKLSLGPDRMRLDTGQGVSMVSIGGEDGKMLMIQHNERRYLEFTAEMMAGMMGMMGQMPQEQMEEAQDQTPPTFTRTGNTKQVGEWAAYEVLVEHPDQDDEMIMWFSQDLDADFRAIAQQAVESMSSLFDNPMLRGMGGGGGGGGFMDQIEAQMNAANMPDGFPVQVISGSGGSQSVNTLKAIDQNANFEPTTWEAPEEYEKMTIPFRR